MHSMGANPALRGLDQRDIANSNQARDNCGAVAMGERPGDAARSELKWAAFPLQFDFEDRIGFGGAVEDRIPG